MAVPADRRVLLAERDIGCDRTVEELEGMATEQTGHGGGQKTQGAENLGPDQDVHAWTPGPGGFGKQQDRQGHAAQDGDPAHSSALASQLSVLFA